jgi:hypothetical protein
VGIVLERLPLASVLNAESFRRFGRTCIPEIVDNVRGFLECLTGFKSLGRFSFYVMGSRVEASVGLLD